jgi:hypothetical protein
MKALAGKHNKDEDLLTTMAESIGSAIGMIVGKANAAQRSVTKVPMIRAAKRDAKKLARKRKKVEQSTPSDLKKSEVARATRNRLRRAASSAK